MVVGQVCRVPCWPMGPIVAIPVLGVLLVIAAVVFSLVMLIDCLKRKPAEFLNPLTKDGGYDKLIWAAAILLSLWFFCIGAIAYLFVVKMAKPEKSEGEG